MTQSYSVSYWQTNKSTLDSGPTFNIFDSAADISASGVLVALNGDHHIGQIIVSDNMSVVITVAEFTTASTAISILVNANATPATLTVDDTAADIQASFATIGGHATVSSNPKVTSIVISDNGTVTLTAAQAAANNTAIQLLSDANSGTVNVTVKDTAANLASVIKNIVVANNVALTLTIADLMNDGTALAEVSNRNSSAVTFNVSDTASNISGYLNQLETNSQIGTITISDNGAISISIAQLTSDASVLAKLVNANSTPYTLDVTDTASNISGALNTLESNGHVAAITVSDSNAVTVSVAQLTSDASVIAELVNANSTPYKLAVTDSGSNISGALNTLESNGHVSAITISDNAAIAVSIAQLTSDATVIAELVNANSTPYKLDITDSGSNISGALNTLESNGHVSAITISDNAAIGVSIAQLTSDSTVIGELVNANSTPYTLAVTDTAAAISGALDTLESNSHVASITVSNNAAVTVSVAQLTSDATVIGELVNANSTPYTLIVDDTGSNISGALDSLAANSHITSIVISDNAFVHLSVAQLTSDAAAIALLSNANSQPYHLGVWDTAANITTDLNTLNGMSHVTYIKITDNNPITVSVAQLTSDATAIGELHNANGSPYTLTISDTGADISADIAALNSNTHISSIVDSNNTYLTLSVAQLLADTAALGELSYANASPYIVHIQDTAADISAALGTLNGNTHVNKLYITDDGAIAVNVAAFTSDATAIGELRNLDGTSLKIAITDTAADISAGIDTLKANGHVSSVTVSDNGTIDITYAQDSADASVLNVIQGIHYLDVTGVTGVTLNGFTETEFTETLNGSHQVTYETFYTTGEAVIESEAITYNNDGSEVKTLTDVAGTSYESKVENINSSGQVTSEILYSSETPSNSNIIEDIGFTYNQNVYGLTGAEIETYTNVAGQTYTQEEVLYIGSTKELAVVDNANGSISYTAYVTGLTLSGTASTASTFTITGLTGEAFVFTGSFGTNTIKGYTPGSDTITFSHTEFANIAAVEAHTTASGSNTVITLDASDTITLTGVSVSSFESHSSDWIFS